MRSMFEFVTVSSSSYDPASLATKLTQKSAEGWDVVMPLVRGVGSGLKQPAAGGSGDEP